MASDPLGAVKCTHCNGTGVREVYFPMEGEYMPCKCLWCDGVGFTVTEAKEKKDGQ